MLIARELDDENSVISHQAPKLVHLDNPRGVSCCVGSLHTSGESGLKVTKRPPEVYSSEEEEEGRLVTGGGKGCVL